MEKLVSVIVPIYNVEKYLKICVDSIINQTYHNLEIILIDDGSKDSCPAICDEYAKADSRIRVIHQENRGLSSARNSGLDIAHGEYLYFIDSDDCINTRLFEIVVPLAQKNQAKIVQIQLLNVEEEFQDYTRSILEDYRVFHFKRGQALLNIDKENKEYARDIQMSTIVIWSKLYHRDIFQKFRFIDGIRIHEDQMVVHRLIAAADGMVFCEAPLYYYRTNESSLIRKGWKSDKLIIMDCFKDRLDCFLSLPEQEMKEYGLLKNAAKRYFVCILRNYMAVSSNLRGDEQKKYLKEIKKRMKEDYPKYGRLLTFQNKIIFFLFETMPSVFAGVFLLRTSIQESKKNILIVEPLAGMGNRYLALASAHELAVKSGKKLVVIWNIDGALGAKSRDIFRLPAGIKIYETTNLGFRAKPFLRLYSEMIRWWFRKSSDLYYTQDEIADYAAEYMDIEMEKHRKIYVKSWKEFADIDTDSKLKFSFIQPSRQVLDKGKNLFDVIDENTVGIHIRRTDHVDAIKNSPLELFLDRIEKELKKNPHTKFFLATDDRQVAQTISDRYQGKIITYEGKAFKRMGSDGVQDAFVDMLALSKCRKILASFGSTFSRMAGYFGGIPVEVLEKS